MIILCRNQVDKSTNVPATIAGYYYQILLACREITKLRNDEDCVGIEAYADVRIEENKQVIYDDKLIIKKYKTSLEAKFHKDNFSKFDEDIIKTIYNFYRYTSKDKQFIFSTNASIKGNDKELLAINWNNEEDNNKKVQYIKKCILRHSVKHDTEKVYQEYIKFKKSQKINANICTLEEDIFEKNSENYEKYAFINKDCDYLEFAKKIKFEFRNKDKYTTVRELRDEIISNIKSNYPEYEYLVNEGGKDIINALVYEYFQIVTINSNLKDKNQSYNDIKKLSVKNMKICIEQYKSRVKKFYEIFEKNNILELLEQSESKFISNINNPRIYSGSYKNEIIDNFTTLMKKFQKYMRNENNAMKIINKFSIGIDSSWSAVFSAINQASVIAALKKCNSDEVTIGLDEKEDSITNDGIDNVFVADVVKYSYKKYSTSTSRSLEEFITNFSNGLDYSKISENQIVVTSDLIADERPCEMKEEMEKEDFLSGILFDFCETNSDVFQRNITYLKKIDYKCTDCITIRKNDNKMEKNVEKFIGKRCGA